MGDSYRDRVLAIVPTATLVCKRGLFVVMEFPPGVSPGWRHAQELGRRCRSEWKAWASAYQKLTKFKKKKEE